MKKQLVIILASCLLFSAGFLSCKKTPTQPAPNLPSPLFIYFNLAGTPTNIFGLQNSLNTGSGGGAYTSSGFFNFTQDINITINIDKDSILGSDLQALVGQQLPFLGCSGCPQTNVSIDYTPGGFNGNEYMTNPSYNPFPANYLKITSVTFVNTSNVTGVSVNNYAINGVFNAVLSYGTDSMQATNGHFRLLYQEFKGG